MSVSEIDKNIWQGRSDPEPGSERWHQKVKPFIDKSEHGTVLLGFCCDEGVRRNHGRTGARHAPDAIRRALANLAWHGGQPVYDGGNVFCLDGNLERAQRELAAKVSTARYFGHLPIVLGGGHEVAFASWLGLMDCWCDGGLYFDETYRENCSLEEINIGIINFDAHFDLRTPQLSDKVEDERFQKILGGRQSTGSSGTPFAQISNACDVCDDSIKFNYAVLGISRPNNTQALFQRAEALNVWVVEDKAINLNNLPAISGQLAQWMQDKRAIYLSFDIDVLPAHQAPGCSAPAALGVELSLLLPLIEQIKQSGKLMLADIAEVNPEFDIDNRTAKVAARIVHLLHGD